MSNSVNQYVVFKTETLLDIRAITVFGLNAKPNTKSPIGYFGTGLKMAIAVLLRNNIPIRLFIGETEYMFDISDGEFRGVEYGAITMQKRRGLFASWTRELLPFTTELAKNWSLWQAFRELESNTRDESGSSSVQYDLSDDIVAKPDQTLFVIGPSEVFSQVYQERDKIFLPEATRHANFEGWAYGDKRIELFRQPSNHLYYRGIRVKDLDKPSIFTYNILEPIELTEDRTVKHEYSVMESVRRFLSQSEDSGLINNLLNVTDKHWESTLDWDSEYNEKPSAVFIDVLARRQASKRIASGGAPYIPRFGTMYSHAVPPPPTERPLSEQFTSWYESNDVGAYLDEPTQDAFHDLVNKLKGRKL